MKIRKRSSLTGIVSEMNIDVNQDVYTFWELSPVQTRPHVQDAFPLLTPDEREFLLTGITPEEWNGLFSEHDFILGSQS
jgi:hypothetical protein